LLSIINDILDMAKLGSGQFTLEEDCIDANGAIETCLPMIQQMADTNGVSLKAIRDARLPLLWADGKRVNQILINLLSNAVKFTPRGGTVSAEACICDDGSLALVVSDTGIGMTPEQVHTAMQPFRQVDNSLARKYEGTGLGLPLTDGLMQLHGGRMEITSAPGQGTVVKAIFPACRTRRGLADKNRQTDFLATA
jgi:signal transduction histidine kinase